jgi:serine/threonine-protein kinase
VTPERIGRYKVLGLLGQGAMGIVYRGRDEGLERDVALKLMSAAVPDAQDRERFLKEAKAAARLQHPNIITIYELGEHEGAPFMALELLEGCDLHRAIEAGIRPDPAKTLPLVLQVLSGLAHAHEQGIVHRDIKPSNIFLCRGRPAKIMDFGVARLGKGTTTSGAVVGTPYYMSPEQVRGGPIDGRSDLFSVGLILYELVTGEKGFQGDSVVSLLYKIAHESPDISLLPKDPRWSGIRTVLSRTFERDPDERYPTAQAMAAELGEALRSVGGSTEGPTATDSGLLIPAMTSRPATRTGEGGPSAAPPPPPHQAPGPPYLALAGLLVALGVGTVVVLRAPWRGSPSPTPSAAPSPAPQASAPPPSPASPPPATEPRTPGSPKAALPTRTPSVAAPSPAPTPVPTPSTAPSEAPVVVGSLERAQELFERHELQGALLEARAVLAQHPGDATAKALAQKVEAALVVEQRIRNAREALRKGDKDTALAEIKLGFAVDPKDPRLIDLFREATQ